MFQCKRCDVEFRDGVQCSSCMGHFDFACGGISEAGYRRLGDRKNVWKCSTCKTASPLILPTTKSASSKSPVPADMDMVLQELKRLSSQVAVLPELLDSVKNIKEELNELKTIKPELAHMTESLDFVHHAVEELKSKITDIDKEIQLLHKTKEDVQHLQLRVEKLESLLQQNEQRSRMNNIEIKGVPATQSENLFSIVSKIGDLIKCTLSRDQINYVARIPMRNDSQHKTIIVSVHSRYLKDDYVAAAKRSTIYPSSIGLTGDTRIFINDHLTLENKVLLNKAKAIAKERGFSFVWVKGCKILMRKNPTTHVISIRSELDLKKLAS